MSKQPNQRKRRPRLTARQAVEQVVHTLHDAGHQALLAGGCVRDMLLGREPDDYDVATSARPEDVQQLFRRTLSVGAQFGVVVVMLPGHQFEVATFRSDDAYVDGRRPQNVAFTDARHDAQRRDFTINGMFYDLIRKQVIDHVGGRQDLDAHLVRAIGSAQDRIAEDHLRMLRAIRFAARFDFAIEEATWQAILQHARHIERISPERVAMELEIILTDPTRSRGLQLTHESKLLTAIFPELSDPQIRLGLEVVRRLPHKIDFALALAGLFVECPDAQAAQLCRNLRLSNGVRKAIQWLVSRRERLLNAIAPTRGRLKLWLASPGFADLLELCRAWLDATGQSDDPLRQLAQQIEELGDEPIQPEPLLDGHELIQLGARPGPMVGLLADDLYLAQLENEITTKPDARAWVGRWLKRHGVKTPHPPEKNH